MRLIDADNLRFSKGINMNGILYVPFCEISKAPTVDAVEVVRCRECKFYLDAFGGHTCVNDFWNDECVIPTEPNDFCSYGERKEAAE